MLYLVVLCAASTGRCAGAVRCLHFGRCCIFLSCEVVPHRAYSRRLAKRLRADSAGGVRLTSPTATARLRIALLSQLLACNCRLLVKPLVGLWISESGDQGADSLLAYPPRTVALGPSLNRKKLAAPGIPIANYSSRPALRHSLIRQLLQPPYVMRLHPCFASLSLTAHPSLAAPMSPA